MKLALLLLTTLLLSISHSIFATPIVLQNSANLSSTNVNKVLKWYTKHPHTMGSAQQMVIANDLADTMRLLGYRTTLESFQANIPNLQAKKLGGTSNSAKLTTQVTGNNIIATRIGKQKCAVILAGHYDTKVFKDFRFIGANDGGSSTALLVELARILKQAKKNANNLSNCDLSIVFFDGEESVLPQWHDGLQKLGRQDNLYGSTIFVKDMLQKKGSTTTFQGKPLKLVIILDMIGHKNQQLFITKGSDINYTKQFLDLSAKIKITYNNIFLQDDHYPFWNIAPFLHIIDWTNLDEWHTDKDTLHVVSADNIVNLGNTLKHFLSQSGGV